MTTVVFIGFVDLVVFIVICFTALRIFPEYLVVARIEMCLARAGHIE